VRNEIPDAAITTDIIVGFPGETEEDFQQTIDLVRQAKFASAFTYQYSKRPGTPAAQMPNQIDPKVINERYERLSKVINEVILEQNKKQIGKVVEVLVSNNKGKTEQHIKTMSGRAKDNRLIHFFPSPEFNIRPGDFVEVEITQAQPFYLVSNKKILKVRNTKAGDIWQVGKEDTTNQVLLGIPTLARN
jgi:tRNA-2-methylthio-N6-dimethylallyladenosine synthase